MSDSEEDHFLDLVDPQPELVREYIEEGDPNDAYEYIVWLWLDDGIYFGFWLEPRPAPEVEILEEIITVEDSSDSEPSDMEDESVSEENSRVDEDFFPDSSSGSDSSDVD